HLVVAHHLEHHALVETELADACHRPDPARTADAHGRQEHKWPDALARSQRVGVMRPRCSQAESSPGSVIRWPTPPDASDGAAPRTVSPRRSPGGLYLTLP